MAGVALRAPRLAPVALVAAGVGTAALLGLVLARDLSLGVGLLLALGFAPLALLRPVLGMAAYAGIVFVEHLPVVSIGPNAAALLVLAAWIGILGATRAHVRAVVARDRGFFLAVAGLVLWLSLSLLWAENPLRAWWELFAYLFSLLILLVFATGLRRAEHVRLLALGFVLGAAASVAIGLAESGLQSGDTAIESATAFEGRLRGGSGDPNYLAAGLVPCAALTSALLASTRGALARLGLVGILLLCGVGLAATQSRGGMVAALVALASAFVLARRHRIQVAGLATLVALLAAVWFAANPGAFERVTELDGGGTGRSDLWRVAAQMWGDQPVAGVGLENYPERAAEYAQEPGALEFGELITERPKLVHNAYLQMLAEAGVIGALLFVLVLGLGVRLAWLAVRRFDAAGDVPLALLARAVVVSLLAMAAASFFLSNGPDKRLWILLALAVALRTIAEERTKDAGGALAAR